MSLTITPLQEHIAAEVSGVDVRHGVDEAVAREIEEVLQRYVVIVLRDQPIDDDQQQDYIRRFGPPIVTNTIKELTSRNHRPHLLDIATVDQDGQPLQDGSFVKMYMLANRLWHTDGSQAQPPTRLTALSARILPSVPPDTEYADMRAAWDALPHAMQEQIADLKAEHSIAWSRSQLGMPTDQFSEESLKRRPPVVHPLVRTHPVTGRRSLYLSGHASHIVGWEFARGRKLLDELTAHATQRRFVYAHRWRPDDLLMWDNSSSMHRALAYEGPEPRVLRWSGVRELAPV